MLFVATSRTLNLGGMYAQLQETGLFSALFSDPTHGFGPRCVNDILAENVFPFVTQNGHQVILTFDPMVIALFPADRILLLDLDKNDNLIRIGIDHETGNEISIGFIGDDRFYDPRSMTASDIYRLILGVDRLTLNPLGEIYRNYLVLAGDPFRTDQEHQTMLRGRRKLIKKGFNPKNPVPRKKISD